MSRACWVCGLAGSPLEERPGGLRCVDSKPCEARQPERLARTHAAIASASGVTWTKEEIARFAAKIRERVSA